MSGSFHHRMAELSFDGDWSPKCQARGCGMAVDYACEYDMMRAGRPVTGAKLYCDFHAAGFADRHNIDFATAPAIPYADIDKSDRDRWAFSNRKRGNGA